jgi:hypothetical protein
MRRAVSGPPFFIVRECHLGLVSDGRGHVLGCGGCGLWHRDPCDRVGARAQGQSIGSRQQSRSINFVGQQNQVRGGTGQRPRIGNRYFAGCRRTSPRRRHGGRLFECVARGGIGNRSEDRATDLVGRRDGGRDRDGEIHDDGAGEIRDRIGIDLSIDGWNINVKTTAAIEKARNPGG